MLIFTFYECGSSQKIRECENATTESRTHRGHIANHDKEEIPLIKLYGV